MNRSLIQFGRHYLEMVAAMFLGMGVLGVPLLLVLGGFGLSSSEIKDEAPAAFLIGMTVVMTVPMVAWMRHRHHGWPACLDMTAAMAIPTAALIALLGAGVVTDFDLLMMLEHVVMLPAMLVAMLFRVEEYTGHSAHVGRASLGVLP
jgi:flagellar biosynthetic protein FliP